jgi:hypothetical protein
MRQFSSFWKDHHELEGFPRKLINELETAAEVRCRKQMRKHLLIALVFGLGSMALLFAGIFMRTTPLVPFGGVFLQLIVLVVYFLFFRGRAKLFRKELRAEMLARAIKPSCCFDCRYDLRGVQAANCPECGAVIMIETAKEIT